MTPTSGSSSAARYLRAQAMHGELCQSLGFRSRPVQLTAERMVALHQELCRKTLNAEFEPMAEHHVGKRFIDPQLVESIDRHLVERFGSRVQKLGLEERKRVEGMLGRLHNPADPAELRDRMACVDWLRNLKDDRGNVLFFALKQEAKRIRGEYERFLQLLNRIPGRLDNRYYSMFANPLDPLEHQGLGNVKQSLAARVQHASGQTT